MRRLIVLLFLLPSLCEAQAILVAPGVKTMPDTSLGDAAYQECAATGAGFICGGNQQDAIRMEAVNRFLKVFQQLQATPLGQQLMMENRLVWEPPADLPAPPPPPPPPDVTPPTVTLTSPTNGGTIQRRSSLFISASAADNKGIDHVEFFVDGASVCSDNTAPYSCQWQVPGTPNRVYSIKAKAFDISGLTKESVTVSVTARN